MNRRALVLAHLATVSLTGTVRAEGIPPAPAASAAPAPAPSASSPAPAPSAEPIPPAPAPTPTAAAPEPAPTTAPTTTTPAPTAAQVAPPPVAPSPAPAAPPAGQQVAPGEAFIHLSVDYPNAWLETRSFVDDGSFVRTCPAPCDLKLRVEGMEARVVAPGMTTSNAFRFDAGLGSAGVRVDGGSASARRAGIITLAAGIPVAMIGMALFGKGRLDGDSGLQAAGIAGLAAGGLSVGVSLPLLLLGTTHVKSAKGELIARAAPLGSAL